MTFTSYSSVKKGKTAKGDIWFYYEGLRSRNGTKANLRLDFTIDWIIVSLYIPSMPGQNCLRLKCKKLTQLD